MKQLITKHFRMWSRGLLLSALSLNGVLLPTGIANAAEEKIVFFVEGKERFHADGCRRLKAAQEYNPDKISEITYTEGIAQGLLYCSRCPVDDPNKGARSGGGSASNAPPQVIVHSDVMSGPFVSMNAAGKLVYSPYTDKGDKILDFSYCGYKASEEPIPDVPVVEILNPLPGEAVSEGAMAYPIGPDSLERIQAALDKVAAREPGLDGYKGAVLLKKGTYYLKGGLVMSSGVVLRGEGDGPDGSVLIFMNPQGTGISMGTEVPTVELDISTNISETYTPSGRMYVTVEDADAFEVGDFVHVRKTVNQDWINTIGMDNPGRGGTRTRKSKPWVPKAYNMKHVREITGIEDNQLWFDAPLPQSIVEEHGGGYITKIDIAGTESLMGIEGLRIVSNYDKSVKSMVRGSEEYEADEENNLNVGIQMNCIQSWVRNCTILHTSRKAVGMTDSRYVTVRDCKSLSPISVIRGGRRYSFSNSDSSMSLVYNCFAEDGRHDFVTGSRDTGPIAFVNGRTQGANAASETHQRWASGVLFDNLIMKDGGGIAAANRKAAGSGQGWSGANVVIWNSVAPFIKVENPPTPEQNFAIGCTAEAPPDAKFSGLQGNGFIESPNSPVEPDSLFEQQLIERIGKERAELVLGLNPTTTKP